VHEMQGQLDEARKAYRESVMADPDFVKPYRRPDRLVTDDGDARRRAAALTPEDLAVVQQQVRQWVLRWFARAGHLYPADARDMAGRDDRQLWGKESRLANDGKWPN
jgi:hypothetical protein